MTRPALSPLAFAIGIAAAIALSSCGSGNNAKLLPGTTAQEITRNLARVRELAAEGECISAQDAALQVSTQVDDLHGIDPKLKQARRDGATKLNEVVRTCAQETTEETTEESLPTTTEATTAKSEKEGKPAKEKHQPPGHVESETAEPPKETTPSGPPHGEAKGHEEAPEGGGPPSGGIGPGSEA